MRCYFVRTPAIICFLNFFFSSAFAFARMKMIIAGVQCVRACHSLDYSFLCMILFFFSPSHSSSSFFFFHFYSYRVGDGPLKMTTDSAIDGFDDICACCLSAIGLLYIFGHDHHRDPLRRMNGMVDNQTIAQLNI